MAQPSRVQTLVDSSLAVVPPQYIQPPEHRVGALRHDAGASPIVVPVVDLDPQSGDPIPDIRRACKDWGAFQVINHGVPISLLEEMKRVGLAFFQSPTEAKLRYVCDPRFPASEGYGSKMLANDGGVLDWRDYFDHHTLPESRRQPNRWPDYPNNYRDIVAEYSNSMKALAQKLLSMISISLGLAPSYIEDVIGDVYQNITISYYPACPQPELALGLQAHSDIGAISLLIQDDVGGLEVLKDGEWVLVQPLSDAIIVLLADQIEIITNGVYTSAEHRALVNATQARLSVATFYDPSKTRLISPAAELITNSSPQKYRSVVYGDYLLSWYGKGPEGKRNLDALLIHQ